MSEQRIIVTELEYVTTTKDEYDALRARIAELEARESRITEIENHITELEAREELMANKIWEQLKRISKLEAWITEASSAFNIDGSKDTLEEALGLVRMCHEGRAAIDRVAELEATLKEYANPDNWDNKHIREGGMNVWYGTDDDGYGLAHIALEKKP
jgi:BMFP domain-containing protein YqiC